MDNATITANILYAIEQEAEAFRFGTTLDFESLYYEERANAATTTFADAGYDYEGPEHAHYCAKATPAEIHAYNLRQLYQRLKVALEAPMQADLLRQLLEKHGVKEVRLVDGELRLDFDDLYSVSWVYDDERGSQSYEKGCWFMDSRSRGEGAFAINNDEACASILQQRDEWERTK